MIRRILASLRAVLPEYEDRWDQGYSAGLAVATRAGGLRVLHGRAEALADVAAILNCGATLVEIDEAVRGLQEGAGAAKAQTDRAEAENDALRAERNRLIGELRQRGLSRNAG